MEINMELLNTLIKIFEKDDRFTSEGKLLKNVIVESALKYDPKLIKLLLSDNKVKEHFFEEVEGILIFDKEKFMKFVDNKEFLPDSFTSFKNKIGLTADKKYLANSKEVVLSWPYKDCVLEGGMKDEDEKRNEVFHNEILAPDEIDHLLEPKVFTNFKRIDAKGEHKVKEIKQDDNLIIKGNNLLVLHSLKKRYKNRVKLIYIDPPYNTGEDSFSYNDSFNHSTWLTFMRNRLEVAKELLTKDGSIWISLDDNELYYLKVMCDEIFGSENFITNIIWQKRTARDNRKSFSVNQDYILVFSKNKREFGSSVNRLPMNEDIKARYKNPDNDPRGSWQSIALTGQAGHATKAQFYEITTPTGKKYSAPKGLCWLYTHEKFKEEVKKNNIYFPKNGDGMPRRKSFLKDNEDKGMVPETIWLSKDVGTNDSAKKELLALFKDTSDSVFVTPKPELLLKRIIEIGSNPGDIVLDFFLGSGTTPAVAHKLSRKYIGVEQLDYGTNDYFSRLNKVISGEQGGISKDVEWKGGGSFIYCEIYNLNETYLNSIKKINESKGLLKLWNEIKENSFLSYKIDPSDIDKNIELFENLTINQQKELLIKCLEKNDLALNYVNMKDKQYNVNVEETKQNTDFYEGKI